jgi:hypothetical protein
MRSFGVADEKFTWWWIPTPRALREAIWCESSTTSFPVEPLVVLPRRDARPRPAGLPPRPRKVTSLTVTSTCDKDARPAGLHPSRRQLGAR